MLFTETTPKRARRAKVEHSWHNRIRAALLLSFWCLQGGVLFHKSLTSCAVCHWRDYKEDMQENFEKMWLDSSHWIAVYCDLFFLMCVIWLREFEHLPAWQTVLFGLPRHPLKQTRQNNTFTFIWRSVILIKVDKLFLGFSYEWIWVRGQKRSEPVQTGDRVCNETVWQLACVGGLQLPLGSRRNQSTWRFTLCLWCPVLQVLYFPKNWVQLSLVQICCLCSVKGWPNLSAEIKVRMM